MAILSTLTLNNSFFNSDGNMLNDPRRSIGSINKTGKLGALSLFKYDRTERRDIADFGQAVINAMNTHVAVIDREGEIILVNNAWKRFMQESCDYCVYHLGVGANYWRYLATCIRKSCEASAKKAKILAGTQAILKGEETHFILEYPCQGPAGEHWFLLSATPLGTEPLGVVISHLDITTRRQSEQALKEANQQLRHLSARMETALEEERSHIARELHDELGQRLTAIRMELAWAGSRLHEDQPILKEKFNELIQFVDSTTTVVRRLSSDLRPTMLDDLGPIAAIEWLTEDFGMRTGINCRLILEAIDLNEDDALATGLFRMVQESLTNVARHSEAKEVTVNIRQTHDSLILTIRDNGKGISDDALTQQNSLGLLGMRERARMLGGTTDIVRRPDGGTEVRIVLPLPVKTDTGVRP